MALSITIILSGWLFIVNLAWLIKKIRLMCVQRYPPKCKHKRKSLNFCSDCGAKVSEPTVLTVDLTGENRDLYDRDPTKYPIGTLQRINWIFGTGTAHRRWIFRRVIQDKQGWIWWQYQCPYCHHDLSPGPTGGASTNQVCKECCINFGCLAGAPD